MTKSILKTMNKDLIVSCPTCKKSIRWQDCEAFRPFCSKRCQLIDLGEWASESHKIAGPPIMEDEDGQPEDLLK